MNESFPLLQLIGEETAAMAASFPYGSSAEMLSSLAETIMARWQQLKNEEQRRAELYALKDASQELIQANVSRIVGGLADVDPQRFGSVGDRSCLFLYLTRVASALQVYPFPDEQGQLYVTQLTDKGGALRVYADTGEPGLKDTGVLMTCLGSPFAENRVPIDITGDLARGIDCLEQGDLDEALANLDRVLEFDPDHVEAHLLRGRVRHNRGDLLGSTDDYAEAGRLDPEWAQALASAGLTFDPVPEVFGIERDPHVLPQGDRPPLGPRAMVSAIVWVMVGVVVSGLIGWLYACLPFSGVGNIAAESWGLATWLVLWSLFTALLATFGLSFGFGVVFTHFNGGIRQARFFALGGGLLGLSLGALTGGVYFLPAAGVGTLAGLLVAVVLFVAGAHAAWWMVWASDGGVQKRALAVVRLGSLALLAACPLIGGVLTGVGWVSADMLAGATIGLTVGLIAGYYLGAVLSILTENMAGAILGVAGLSLAGLVVGAVRGKADLAGVYEWIGTVMRAGVLGAIAGAATAFVVGLVGGTICPGSFGGAMGAAFRLEDPSGGSRGTVIFAAMVGIFPGACLGLWTGTTLGILTYWGGEHGGAISWTTAASLTGGLLALVFFGTQIVLPHRGTPRSLAGMLSVALAGVFLGGIVTVLGSYFGVSVGSQGYWLLGQAAAGVFIGAKCWEFFGGNVEPPSLFPF